MKIQAQALSKRKENILNFNRNLHSIPKLLRVYELPTFTTVNLYSHADCIVPLHRKEPHESACYMFVEGDFLHRAVICITTQGL